MNFFFIELLFLMLF